MRLLLDEMYAPVIAEQLRARGHDVVSVHEASHRHLLGHSDADIVAAAVVEGQTVVTENVQDFGPLEAAALSRGEPFPILIFTTNDRFPRARAATVGRMVLALDAVLRGPAPIWSLFLESADGEHPDR